MAKKRRASRILRRILYPIADLRFYRKAYPIPETMFDPSLLLSPQLFLLGILFRHQAFRASSLTSAQHLDNLDIHPGERELPLPLKKEFDDVYIFRRAVESLTGYELSRDKLISSSMMSSWIKRIGEILGFEYTTIPYSLRYNAGNAWDQSCTFLYFSTWHR